VILSVYDLLLTIRTPSHEAFPGIERDRIVKEQFPLHDRPGRRFLSMTLLNSPGSKTTHLSLSIKRQKYSLYGEPPYTEHAFEKGIVLDVLKMLKSIIPDVQ
jgi:hypothetical protein